MQVKVGISRFIIVCSALLLSLPTAAVEGCIEAPKRSTPCPHQIYKLMKLKKDQPSQITCICITDFEQFLTPAKDQTAKIMRKMNLKQLAAELQLTETQVANLAKR
jgi:hypothetical protein